MKRKIKPFSLRRGGVLQYAVAFNRRGADGAKSCSTDSSETTALGRDECIKIVASAVQQVTSTLKVDLTSPQVRSQRHVRRQKPPFELVFSGIVSLCY